MSKGMIGALILLFALWPGPALPQSGEIYKIVDKDGNVIYTDQRPPGGAEPMDLPELSVIETDVQVPAKPSADEVAAGAEPAPMTPRELRRQFADFRITQPQQDETFWGTANTVVVAWGSAQEMPPELSARLYVDGAPQDVPPRGSLSLTLERGEHNVYVELLDGRKRRVLATETVTFFVKQYSQNFNRQNPGGGDS